MRGGEEREPPGNVLVAEGKGFPGKQDEWIKNGAPCDLILVERVVQMARADRIFREDQRTRVYIPDRKCPVTDELGEAVGTPLFVGRRDDRNVGRANR